MTNATNIARVEIPGKREPLAPGESHVYLGEVPDKAKYFIGLRLLKLEERETSTQAEAVPSEEKKRRGRPTVAQEL